MIKTILLTFLILTALVTYSYYQPVQTYYDNTTLINVNGVQCDVDWCDGFSEDDDVVFIDDDTIRNTINGKTCKVACQHGNMDRTKKDKLKTSGTEFSRKRHMIVDIDGVVDWIS